MPTGLLEDLDQRALATCLSRSDYIRIALMEKMGRRNMFDPPAAPLGISKPPSSVPGDLLNDPEGFYWPD
jgi:hypothetical protein